MTIRKAIPIFSILFQSFSGIAQQRYPAEVQKALEQTSNRNELEKALNYFYKTNNSLKIKSINFLIANMVIHRSYSYYWIDEKGNRIHYDEGEYETFGKAVESFNQLKARYGNLRPIRYTYRDIDSIKASMLIENVESAYKMYKSRFNSHASPSSEEGYLEYILPYRTSIEPLQNWRKTYETKFAGLIDDKALLDSQILSIGKNIKKWFTNTYKIESKNEPLPRLGSLQLLSRKKGACEDIADLATFIARSQGYEAAVDYVPAWATASGVHFLNYINISPKVTPHYDAADGYVLDTLAREPGKVLRTTYSIQPETIASQLKNDTAQIPDNFMRLQNYKDVTKEYWQTSSIKLDLFKPKVFNPKAAYICVWNYSKWIPVWFGAIQDDSKVVFSDMCKGAVYLPAYYVNGKIIPAGWPIVNGYSSTKILRPDISKKHTVHLREEPKYLVFRSGKKYKLYYWKNTWIFIGEQIPKEKTNELVFESVPLNALLFLLPDYTQGKERPFFISEDGQRFWY